MKMALLLGIVLARLEKYCGPGSPLDSPSDSPSDSPLVVGEFPPCLASSIASLAYNKASGLYLAYRVGLPSSSKKSSFTLGKVLTANILSKFVEKSGQSV